MSLPGQIFEKDSVAGAEAPYCSVAYTNLHLTPRHEYSILTARSIVEIVEITVGRTAKGKIGSCLRYRPFDPGGATTGGGVGVGGNTESVVAPPPHDIAVASSGINPHKSFFIS